MKVLAVLLTLFSGVGVWAENLSDGQVILILQTANNADIDAGRLASTKALSAEVKEYAQHMVQDHATANKDTADLVRRAGLTPSASDTNGSMKKKADTGSAQLKKLNGSAFDKEYIDQEVAFHQDVLNAIDQTLLPSTKNSDLKALVQKVRPTIESHLAKAKAIQAQL